MTNHQNRWFGAWVVLGLIWTGLSFGAEGEEGRVSRYTVPIQKILLKWPTQDIPASPPNGAPVWLKGIKTPGRDTYVGCKKVMIINAPFDRVVQLMEGFENYHEMYDGLVGVKVLKRDGNKIYTDWERDSPAFFIPNIRYKQIFWVEKPKAGQAIYRYQLQFSDAVNFADGFIVLDAVGPKGESTKLSSIDFYDAKWGVLGALARGRVWKESFEGDFKGSLAFKHKAEHPDWDRKRLKKESEQMLDRFPVEPIQFDDQLNPDAP